MQCGASLRILTLRMGARNEHRVLSLVLKSGSKVFQKIPSPATDGRRTGSAAPYAELTLPSPPSRRVEAPMVPACYLFVVHQCILAPVLPFSLDFFVLQQPECNMAHAIAEPLVYLSKAQTDIVARLFPSLARRGCHSASLPTIWGWEKRAKSVGFYAPAACPGCGRPNSRTYTVCGATTSHSAGD